MTLELVEPRDREVAAPLFTPATVPPLTRRLSTLQAISALRRNVLEVIDAELFRIPHRQLRWLGRRYLLVGGDPELMQAIFLDHAEVFPKSEAQQRVLRPALGLGLLSAEGADWRRQRRAAAPAFRNEALQRMVPTFAAAAEESAARLCADGVAGPVDVLPEMTRATLDVILTTLLAVDDGRFDREGLSRTLRDYLEAVASPDLFDLLGAPAWVPRPWRRRHRRMTASMRTAAREALERRRTSGEDKGDLLSALLAARDPESGRGLNDDELVDNILTFILAGHETTSLLLTWTLYLIANAPNVQRRLRDEVHTVVGDGLVTADHLDRLHLHEQVLNESLRLFTPASILQRRALKDVDLGPVRVRKGDEVVCYLYVLHRSELLWDDPAAFDPDRFSPERSEGRHRFTFTPFGGGPRVCIGARFAMMEAKTFLATFVRAFDVAPASTVQPLPIVRVTLRPDGGMPLKINRRAPNA